MLHNHHTHGCQHYNIQHCKICDVTYCVDCKKEWGTRTVINIPTYFGGGGGVSGVLNVPGGHSH